MSLVALSCRADLILSRSCLFSDIRTFSGPLPFWANRNRMHQAPSICLWKECDKHSLHPAGPRRLRLRCRFLFPFIMAAYKLQTQPIKQDSDYGLKDASVTARFSIHTIQLVPFQIRGSFRRCVIGTWMGGYLSGATLVYCLISRLFLDCSLLVCVCVSSSQLVVVFCFCRLYALTTSSIHLLAVHPPLISSDHFMHCNTHLVAVLVLILIKDIFIGIDPHFHDLKNGM